MRSTVAKNDRSAAAASCVRNVRFGAAGSGDTEVAGVAASALCSTESRMVVSAAKLNKHVDRPSGHSR